MTDTKQLLDKANHLPQGPGCYLMKDKNSRVIYVGKAKKLKSRVVSYFNQSAKSVKTEYMVSHVTDFDFILTHSDAESFVLENNLIKEHGPKYNIRLRDDKSYPYILVNWEEDFPRLEYVRRPKKGKNRELFGPFPQGSNISMILRVLTKSFSLRDCSLTEFRSRKTPCLLHQMRQCSAPCVGLIDKDQYEEDIKLALGLFQGKIKATRTLNKLKERMMSLAENEEYEHAAIIRDHLQLLEDFVKQSFDQQVESLDDEKNLDVWAFYEGVEEIDFSVYMIRSGMLLGQKNFSFVKSELIEEMGEEIIQKIWQYYEGSEELVPEMIIVDRESEELETLAAALKVKVKGRMKKYLPLISMCRKHAEESQRIRISNEDSVYIGLRKLQELLNLKERPRLLECYDIAIWQGQSPAASQIVFEEGKADKARYRYYHMQTRPEGNNDFAMMEEVIIRRIPHGKLPDVFVVDGGVAQVNTVTAVMRENNLDIPVVGIAKSRDLSRGDFKSKDVDRSEERLVIPGRTNPYILNKCPSLFKIIVSMRDEAHRFSRKLHHKAESKRTMSTWIDDIAGLGLESKKKILSNLTMTKDELRGMNITDLGNLFGLKSPQAKALWEHLQEESDSED
ncbi:MAG: excinuclease ABC subunit UvrC [Bacteriovoracaceae bacterium]|jgi:excinuclease ABC subunit C